MARTYLFSDLKPADWSKKAAGKHCLVCDCAKPEDSICCNLCWIHLEETRQNQIINLLPSRDRGWALRKMCAWAGRAAMPTRKQITLLTGKLFKELNYV